MLIIDRIMAWWKQRQRDKQLKLACAKDRPPILRCLALSEYLMNVDFSGVSHHDLMFYKTRLRCHNFSHYVSMLMFLGQTLKAEGVLLRRNAEYLNEFVDVAQIGIFTFIGGKDHTSAIKEFLRSNYFLCTELAKCLDKDTMESRHTLMLVQTYIGVLEDTLVVMLKLAQ